MSDYILELRKIVGHIPIILSTAGVIILDQDNRVLLQLRTDNHQWGLPGGCLELGETVEEAARREVFEETGLTIEKCQLFGIYSGQEQHYIYPNGDEVYFNNTVFLTHHYKGTLNKDKKESKDLRFFDLTHLPTELMSPCIPILKDLQLSTRP